MANWAITTYIVTGDEHELQDLNRKMLSQEKRTVSLVKNDFGKTFLGNLVELLGGKIDGDGGVYCRGFWEGRELHDGKLSFMTETAWHEMDEWRHFLQQHYPNLKFYYMTEESGDHIYETNDAEGMYFPYRYVVEISGSNPDAEYMEFKTFDEAKEKIEEVIGRKLEDDEDLDAALDEWAEGREFEIDYAGYHEFKIVDD